MEKRRFGGGRKKKAYLIQRQACHSTQLELLVLSRIWRLAICTEPLLQNVGSLLGKVAASFTVECTVIDTDMLLEPNIEITRFEACCWCSIWLVGIVD